MRWRWSRRGAGKAVQPKTREIYGRPGLETGRGPGRILILLAIEKLDIYSSIKAETKSSGAPAATTLLLYRPAAHAILARSVVHFVGSSTYVHTRLAARGRSFDPLPPPPPPPPLVWVQVTECLHTAPW